MMTLIVLLAAVALIVGAGEAVRGQCRRMIGRPIPVPVRSEPVATVAAAEVAAPETATAHAIAA